ncbi:MULTISPECIES: response regulator transcription factor [Shouchella]|uniref:Response regulator transcription factor n=2 Tax=Shouchella TaxID=2893057 RepID=A0ABY7WC62_9BACI|nr:MULTISPECIES: response regulator transcription factor [Shouchella]MED4127757.1 response regulator transcription factor [Shouchella miscanthi]WDF05219.1 response regulator transcription factor [Shouchella hunanensis]
MSRERTILIVDDEPDLVKLVSTYVKKEGYRPLEAGSGTDALRLLGQHPIDLVILDIMMEGTDGFEVCKAIREQYAVPVIMLTARSHEEDKVKALKLGADDYMEKPFSPRELMARIEATLRRSYQMNEQPNRLVFHDLQINRDARMVFVGEDEVPLTRREFDLLVYLAEHKNRSFTREHLFTQIWSDLSTSSLRTVDTHIKTLRLKLGENGKKVQTVWGIGYKFGENE